eukprot:GHUV01042986.1.p1 GENE.GHUV01042986.1~~GHUV01042986.1.p1  ORF type:complete len:184 (-),score=59.40 GHUV01042986.1:28-579(-)
MAMGFAMLSLRTVAALPTAGPWKGAGLSSFQCHCKPPTDGNCLLFLFAQTDVRLLKEKVKRKQAILVRQEEELASRDTQLAAAQRDAATLTHSKDNLTAEVAALKSDNAELRAKLEESRQQLQSNEQMIRWLNQQVGVLAHSIWCGHLALRNHYNNLQLYQARAVQHQVPWQMLACRAWVVVL